MFHGERLLSSSAWEGSGCRGQGKERGRALQMSCQGNATVFPLHPSKEEHKYEPKQGLCALKELVFIHKEDFSCCETDGRHFWPSWNVWYCLHSDACVGQEQNTLLCNVSCLVKKLIQHRAIQTTGKQGGVDGLPCHSALSFLLAERELLALQSMSPGSSKKGKGQQVSEGSKNHMKLLLKSNGKRTGNSYKQEAFPFSRALLTSASCQQQLQSMGWGRHL